MAIKISKSLNGDKIVFLARDRKKVLARADSMEELEAMLKKREEQPVASEPKVKEEVKEADGREAEKGSGKLRLGGFKSKRKKG